MNQICSDINETRACMDLDIGGAGRVMQGDPDPTSLGKFKFLNSHCKTIENRPRTVTPPPHTPMAKKEICIDPLIGRYK